MDAPSERAASTIDPKLMVRVAKGEHQAFSQLYDQSSAVLYTLALRILGSRDEAAELLQEVYLEVWRKVARYDISRGTPIAWLITLTRSRAIHQLRTHDVRTHRHAHESSGTLAAGHTADRNPEHVEALADQEMHNLVGGALASLPQAQLQAIELAYYEGFSQGEMATRLNEPLGTVKTHLKLGLSKLCESLRHCWQQGDRL